MQTLPWIIALAAVALLASVTTVLALRTRRPAKKPAPLPTEWALTPRPVFSSDERRVYRRLREALPHHVVLTKLPLVRFCQPSEPADVRFWYELLGAIHVTFAVCSANGRVLAAIDLDTERGGSRRAAQIKQSVLSACRVRHLRCPVDNLPTVAELQLLVPQSGLASRGPLQAPVQSLHEARDHLSSTVAHRRAERSALWQDSTLYGDSFFAPDSRADSLGNSEFASLAAAAAARSHASVTELPRRQPMARDDIGGVVVDDPVEYATGTRR